MESFFTFLEKRVADCSSLLCIGLDPHLSDLQTPNAAGALASCLNLVKKTAPYAAAFKPNAAFFEQFGAPGWEALKSVIDAVRNESQRQGSLIPVILDAKRGDIASTAVAYAKSAFTTLGAHAVTLSPYLGKDSIDPFLTDREKAGFVVPGPRPGRPGRRHERRASCRPAPGRQGHAALGIARHRPRRRSGYGRGKTAR
ncbi:MAG: orotidine-5'-phosphate decarboxylase [Candidatus Aminicenantes bacterium]|nr:orotidine-5'-phosphate decarboxylase [Candidatus Aminicenantes bacterium]